MCLWIKGLLVMYIHRYAAYCYRPRVAWSVGRTDCLSVCLPITLVSPAKNGWTDRNAVWVKDFGVAREPCHALMTKCRYCRYPATKDVVMATTFVFLYIRCTLAPPGIWRIRLNRPCAAAMRPYVKLLWPLVLQCCYDWSSSVFMGSLYVNENSPLFVSIDFYLTSC